MTVTVGILNLVLGIVYAQYGTMTLVDMARHWDRLGFSHFGAAWIAMAFTCGPHHFTHGTHILFEGHPAGWLDLAAVAVGFPAGVIWFLLRVEAFRGGRGDRFVSGTPGWVLALPLLAGAYAGIVLATVAGIPGLHSGRLVAALPNLILVVLYATIGYYLARTQLANRRPLGGWSVSGLSLAIIFPTCAAMHGVYAFYALTTLYTPDWHMGLIDWVAVPAAVYFVWVVQALYRGTYRDWNSTGRAIPATATRQTQAMNTAWTGSRAHSSA